MAKILVADDNSNIQKMVGLALKDHGIEVVAVGNGEAAVRKISELKPDLVLADVFMPVRNGYEVCQYVKEDSALAHIPVILLVGAFDPLDEQEAQRVGADGVLKKPFVPPDPLISMVKSALVRAGVAHAGFTPAVPEPPPPPVAAVEPAPRNVAPKSFPKVTDVETESFVEEVSRRPSEVKIAQDSQPVAFGSLLETKGAEIEDDLRDMAPANSSLGAERDWRSADTEEEQEESEDSKASWRRDAGDEQFVSDVARSAKDWRDLGVEDPNAPAAAQSARHEGWTPTREKQDPTKAAAVSDIAPAAPFAGDAWAAAISTGSEDRTGVAEVERPHAEVAGPAATAQKAVPESSPVVHATEAPAAEPTEKSRTSSWFSTPPSPWETEVQKAARLASTWDAPVRDAGAPSSEPGVEARGDVVTPASYQASSAPDEIEVVPEAPAISAAAVEAIREETAHLAENGAGSTEPANVGSFLTRAAPDGKPELDVDAVVAKVLARMSPGVLESVTRDILKPVIEAIVREELSGKKH